MNDIEKFINFVNKDTSKRKTTHDNDDIIINSLHDSAFTELQNFTKNIVSVKGKTLNRILTTIKKEYVEKINHYKQYKNQMNNNKNKILVGNPNFIKLLLIAVSSICIKIIDEMKQYILKNKKFTYEQVLIEVSKNYDLTQPIKKRKIINYKPDDDDFYGENSDDDDTDDDDDSDSDSDDDNKNDIINKDSKELLDLLQKSKNNINDANEELINYYTKLSKKDKKDIKENIIEIYKSQTEMKPLLLQIMDFPLPMNQKRHILKYYNNLMNNRLSDNKLKNWFESLMSIPFGKYNEFKTINCNSLDEIKTFLNKLQECMDNAVYGHNDAKHHIIQIMAQQIRNPKSKGNIIGICGIHGNGKTSIVKDGIAKAMNKPFVFISLGGATDSSFLEGHSYTYEGSLYGRIVNGLITSKCMDPIFYFDELDKISKTPKGDEIMNILIHLTDPIQNEHFRDKYFHGIDIDLSRATIIFSFNEIENINPILLDRITIVKTKCLLTYEKINIVNNYLLRDIMKDMGLNFDDVKIDDNIIQFIISNYTQEGGVRKLKSLLYLIVRELNILNLLKNKLNDKKIKFPINLTLDDVKFLLKNEHIVKPDKTHEKDMIGIMNGLWANSYGYGGILQIQTLWVPSTIPYDIKTTGNLQQVIKESANVASTLAFNRLDKHLQNEYLNNWKERPQGIHIHFPDGATPKDGPSAGTALTITILSLLSKKKIRHDIAITGEINFQGRVTAIGGLENKLEGAKRAGIKLVLYPKENQKDMDIIYKRNSTLIDDDFKVQPIETLDEAIEFSIIN